MTPTVGRIVIYCLSEADAQAINKRRADAKFLPPGDTGVVVHTGNWATAGEEYPAIVVRMFRTADEVNLQVLLDGNDTYWATSRSEGKELGQWHWPERV